MDSVVQSKRHGLYNLGSYFYCIGLVLFVTSVTVPDLWIYDRESSSSKRLSGRSVWNFGVRVCFNSRSSTWFCKEQHAYHDRLLASFCCLCLGTLAQLIACVVLMVNRTMQTVLVARFFPECLAGLAAQLNVTGILIYVSVTHSAVNVVYGPGLALNVMGILLAYAGLTFTGLWKDADRPKTLATKSSSPNCAMR